MRQGNSEAQGMRHDHTLHWRAPTTKGENVMLSRLRIGPKLLLAPALVLALLVASSGAAYWAMLRQNQSLDVIVSVRAARIREAGALVAEAQAAHANSYRLLTWISASVSARRIAALEADITHSHARLRARLAQLAARSAAASVQRRLLGQALAAHGLHAAAVREVIELAGGGDQSLAASAMIKAEQAFAREALWLAALAGHEQQGSEADARRAAADFTLLQRLLAALVALSVLLSLAVTLAVRRALLRDVHAIGRSARALASGNLTARTRADGADEIADTARTLEASILSLNGALRDIVNAARSVGSGARLVAQEHSALALRDHRKEDDAALVQAAAAAAARLQAQALSLAQAVAAFKLDEAMAPVAAGKPRLWLAARRD
jgi:HAMP domain-containing protein